ncbi:MAG TPA: hypothetical protein VM889_04480 [Candidatus Thermoplasmatota archaeon]|nr:hypothetical protein [Candidatus Thermoplasmatota archaeon]
MRLPVMVLVSLAVILPVAYAQPSPPPIRVEPGDSGMSVVSDSYAFGFSQSPLRLHQVAFAGTPLFASVAYPSDAAGYHVAGASFRILPPSPIRAPLLHFTDSAVGEMKIGLPPNPIQPGPVEVVLDDSAALAADGDAFVLSAGPHAFAVRFTAPPVIDGNVLTFAGTMHLVAR